MTETVRLDETFAIVSEAERATTPVRVLKHGDTFAVFDPHGDIMAAPGSEHGVYHAGTRFVSRLELLLGSRQPLLLSSTISVDNTVFTADLTNPDIVKDGQVVLARGLLHLFRTRVLWDGSCLERFRLSNHGLSAIEVPISLRFDADFVDLFEVRGTRRSRRGHRLPDASGPEWVLRYRGLDGVERRTRIASFPKPQRSEEGLATFVVPLEPHGSAEFEIGIACEFHDEARSQLRFDDVRARLKRRVGASEQRECAVSSSSETFNRWVQRQAFPGSARRSAVTGSSRRSSCSGRRPTSRGAS
jgi:glycogen debranching enzyme